MIKLIIFDLDDTLIHPQDAHKELIALRRADVARTLGISHSEAEEKITQLRKSGMSNYQLYESLGLEEGGVKGGNLFRERVLGVPTHRSVVPDLKLAEYLQSLQSEGILLAIVTESPIELALKKLEAAAIPNSLFVKIVGWEGGRPPPKTGDMAHSTFSALFHEFGLEPSEVISIGDEVESDLKVPKNMGAFTILVKVKGYKFTKLKDLKYVDFSIDGISELEKAIAMMKHHVISNSVGSPNSPLAGLARRGVDIVDVKRETKCRNHR